MQQREQEQADEAAAGAHVPLKHITYQVCPVFIMSIVVGFIWHATHLASKAVSSIKNTHAGCVTSAWR